MSSEEKAKELVEKFYRKISRGKYFSASTKKLQSEMCALIAVDEILIIMKEEYLSGSEKIEYWNRVKSAIEKL